MKKVVFSLFIAALAITFAQGQHTFKDVVYDGSLPVTFIGIDFSNARLVGSEGFTDPKEIRDRFFNSWNSLMVNEKDKYDLEKTFKKNKVEYNMDMIRAKNDQTDWTSLVTNNSSDALFLDEAQVKEIVSEYPMPAIEDGVGLVFIVESLDKIGEMGHVWVTFFNPGDKSVIFTERMSEEPRGFGLRNYWARIFYDILRDIQKKKFKKWEREY